MLCLPASGRNTALNIADSYGDCSTLMTDSIRSVKPEGENGWLLALFLNSR